MKHTLTIRDLTLKHQQRTLVDRVELTLKAGQVHALVGASGSGKSLTSLGILDLLPPGVHSSGATLLLDGRPVEATHLRGREVALVLQNPRSAFNPVRSLRQHALETLQTRGLGGAEAERPRSSGTVLTSRSATLMKLSAVVMMRSRIALGRPSIDSRWCSSPWAFSCGLRPKALVGTVRRPRFAARASGAVSDRRRATARR